MKNTRTIVGALLIAVLFLWATRNNSELQAKTDEVQKAALIEKAKQDSLKAIKNPGAKAVPELGPAPAQPGTPVIAAPAPGTAPALPVIKQRLVVVETDNFWVTFDNVGGMVRSLVPKVLANKNGEFPELIQDREGGALSLQFDTTNFAKAIFAVDSTTPDTVKVQDSYTLRFAWRDAAGKSVLREYRFTKDGNSFRSVSRIAGFSPKLYSLEWKGGMRETEQIPQGKALMGTAGYFYSEVVLNNGYNVERQTIDKQTWFNREEGKARWVGLRRKYIAAVINWGNESEAAIGADHIKLDKPDPGTYSLTISDHMSTDSIAFNFVVLPLVHSKIEAMGESYEKIMFSGWEWCGADKWFVWLAGFILRLLNWFHSWIPNYGVAIILLTLLMKFVTMPLTVKQIKSARDMARHKPAMDDIRLRNRANPQKMQQELMEYYRQNNVNPFGAMLGCFPMLLQMPVFIGLFVVLGRAVELRNAPFFGWITDLSAPDVITRVVSIPYLFPEGLTILPFLMMITTFLQTKQTIVDPNQKSMVYMMPVMMFLFSTVMPSGLILYWIISNIFGIGQYLVLNRNRQPVVEVVHAPKRSHHAKK